MVWVWVGIGVYYVVSRVIIYRYWRFLDGGPTGDAWDGILVLITGCVPLIGELVSVLTAMDHRKRKQTLGD